jgi:hypothetical protein
MTLLRGLPTLTARPSVWAAASFVCFRCDNTVIYNNGVYETISPVTCNIEQTIGMGTN